MISSPDKEKPDNALSPLPEQRMELLTEQMAKAEGVTEELKAADQMKWLFLPLHKTLYIPHACNCF